MEGMQIEETRILNPYFVTGISSPIAIDTFQTI